MKRIGTIICLLYIIMTALAQTGKTPTDNKEDAQRQLAVQDLERRKQDAAAEIELTSLLLDEMKANTQTSLNKLQLLSQQLETRVKLIGILEQEVVAIDKNIKSISSDIEILDKDLVKTKENYARSMQNQQQEYHTAQHKVLLVLSAKTLTQSYRRMRYMHEYSDWQKEEAQRIQKKQDEIARRKIQLEGMRKTKQTVIAEREAEIQTLQIEKAQQQKEVKELNKQQKNLQRRLQQQKKEADALDSQLIKMIGEDLKKPDPTEKTATAGKAKTSEKNEKSTAEKAKPAATQSPSKEKNVTPVPLAGKDFVSNKGRLPYPLTAKYTIISRFGEHQHPELSHVRTNNHGIDLRTTTGAEAYAVYKGVVTRVFVMPGYNNNVIVRHGSYLTIYGNLSQVYVKAGDVVDTRQALGKVYTDTSHGNETILHFQLWKERTKLNPESWLKK